MKVAILVPRREDMGYRDEVWAWCRERWERAHPSWPIVEGYHRDGLFNRSAALNAAARSAGRWDVAVIIDADVFIDPTLVEAGVGLAASNGHMVLPHRVRRDLTEAATRRLLAGGDPATVSRTDVARKYREDLGPGADGLVSNVVIVPRRLWETVGGFDEAFRGWGCEDDAFYAACRTFGGVSRLDGVVTHLWHPTAGGRKHAAAYPANQARGQRYRAAIGDVEAIRRLQEEAAAILSMPPEPSVGIPRILHRVVPERTTPEVEGWWARFTMLHPGWRLVTHRDPLDPRDWPITAPYWHLAANGAQFADLIRLEAVLRDGGIYVDSDVEPFRSLDPLLPLHAFAAWEDQNCVPNAVFGAVPGHPAIRAMLDTMLVRLHEPGRRTPAQQVWHCGPGVFTDVLPGREDVLILPPGAFYGVHYADAERASKMRERRYAERNPWAFVLHHYAASWLGEAAS